MVLTFSLVNIQTWNKYEVSVAYKKKMNLLYEELGTTSPSREEIKEHLKEQYDFFGGTIKNYLMAKHDSKKFAAVVSKVVEPFIRMVRLSDFSCFCGQHVDNYL